jgi:hypothetical protein
MPNLSNVRVRPGVAGAMSYPKLGSQVVVSFINGDPARPAVTNYDDPDGPGFIPDEIDLLAGATAARTEHATSAEALILSHQQMLVALGSLIAGLGTSPLSGLTLGTALTTAASDGLFATFLGLLSSATLGPLTKAALLTALAAKTADTAGDTPSIGWPKVLGG